MQNGSSSSGGSGRTFHDTRYYLDEFYGQQHGILHHGPKELAATVTNNHQLPRINQQSLLQNNNHSNHQPTTRGSNGHYHPTQWTTSNTTTSPPHLLPTTNHHWQQQQQLHILQDLLGINTTTSRNHQHIMAKALDALKSSNNDSDADSMLTKASSSCSINNNSNNIMVPQPTHSLEHMATMKQYNMPPTSYLGQYRSTMTNAAVDDEIRAEMMIQARRLHQQLGGGDGGGGGGNTFTATSRNQLHAMAEAMRTSSALEVSSLQNDHPTLALLGSIMATQESGLTNYLYHHRSHPATSTTTARDEDMRNMTSLEHYLQQRRLRAKAEARLRHMRAQSNNSGDHQETKRQRREDPAGTTTPPPSVSMGSGGGGGRRQIAQDGVGVVDRSPKRRRPMLNDMTSTSSLEAASLQLNKLEETRKIGGLLLPKHPQPQFVVAAAPSSVLRSPRAGPVRRASAA